MSNARVVEVNPEMQRIFHKFLDEKGYDETEDFAQFDITNQFFKWYFDTDWDLNDFKNLQGYIKRHSDNPEAIEQGYGGDDFLYLGKEGRCNKYKRSKARSTRARNLH